jgi:hypothetical protein
MRSTEAKRLDLEEAAQEAQDELAHRSTLRDEMQEDRIRVTEKGQDWRDDLRQSARQRAKSPERGRSFSTSRSRTPPVREVPGVPTMSPKAARQLEERVWEAQGWTNSQTTWQAGTYNHQAETWSQRPRHAKAKGKDKGKGKGKDKGKRKKGKKPAKDRDLDSSPRTPTREAQLASPVQLAPLDSAASQSSSEDEDKPRWKA